VETIFVGCHWKIQSLDRLWKSQVLPRTSQVEWTTSKIISKVTGLWLYIMTYSRKNKYQSKGFIKKRSGKYQEQ